MIPLLPLADATGFLQGALASFTLGAAVFVLVFWLWRSLQSSDLEQGDEWRYDVSRINELRREDSIYRMFHPVIKVLSKLNRNVFKDHLPEIQRQILASGQSRYWLPEEFLARVELIGLLLAPFYIYLFTLWMGGAGAMLGVVASLVTMLMLRRQLYLKAHRRLILIKRRLPFLLDLMTLLMEAGATFLHSLEQAVGEFRGHPLSQEFARVLTDMNLGKTRIQAFEAMRDRLQDDEINSILGSMVQAEQLGTPLSGVFRTQSDVLRLKRSQRAEAIASEAGVKMLLPGVLVMASTVIVILGPFAINFLLFGMDM